MSMRVKRLASPGATRQNGQVRGATRIAQPPARSAGKDLLVKCRLAVGPPVAAGLLFEAWLLAAVTAVVTAARGVLRLAQWTAVIAKRTTAFAFAGGARNAAP